MRQDELINLMAIPIVILIGFLFVLSIGNQDLINGRFPLIAFPILLAFSIQWIAYVPAYLKRTERYYDLIGGFSFITVTALCLYLADTITLRSFVLATMVFLWATRLGIFLYIRIRKSGKDSRFDSIKQSPIKFLVAWSMQGLWITFTLAPTMAAILSSEQIDEGVFFYAGSLIWIFGFLFELTADIQKSLFKAKPENKGKFINSGLWAISRHPNYFGEITLWTGVALISFPTLSGLQYLSLSSPIFILILLVYISGIPLLERSANERWGKLQEYQDYKNRTPVLIPFLRRSA